MDVCKYNIIEWNDGRGKKASDGRVFLRLIQADNKKYLDYPLKSIYSIVYNFIL